MTAFWDAQLEDTLSSARRVVPEAVPTEFIKSWLARYDNTAPTSTNAGTCEVAFQRWMKFKEAFSPKFVIDALGSLPFTPTHCIDPFGGSGTTALTCSLLGVRSTTIEVNPFLADLISAKVTPLRASRLADAYLACVDEADDRATTGRLSRGAPSSLMEPGTNGRFVFWSDALNRVLALRAGLEAVECPIARRMLRVLLGSILVEASNVVVNGKGRRYRGGWQRRRVTADHVDQLFNEAVARAARDLSEFRTRERAPVGVLQGDSRRLLSNVAKADVAIFSPPYPNSFDYTDVYNLELWVLGYLDDAASNRALRLNTLRSHVQIGWEPGGPMLSSAHLVNVLEQLEGAQERMWNPNLTSMVRSYFQDIAIVLRDLLSTLNPGGRVIMIIGDSCYAGIRVAAGLITAEVAQELGYAVIEQKPMRTMRKSAQLGGQLELEETCLVLSA